MIVNALQNTKFDKDQLKDEIKRDEGFVSHAYQDPRGYWTIGYGRMIDERLDGGISKGEADFLLTNDIQRTLMEIEVNFPWFSELDGVRQRALLNMAYNLGMRTLLEFKKMLGALKAGDCTVAAKEAQNSKWADQVGERADRIAEMFRNG